MTTTLFADSKVGKPTLLGALQRIGDSGGLHEASGTVNLSTPIVSAQDGPRMAGSANFGGKKAAPFGSKKRAAKSIARARARKAAPALSVVGTNDVELGLDGAKWKHGYIPENAAAVALKEHRKPGSAGASKDSAKVKRDAAKTAAKAGGSAKPKAPSRPAPKPRAKARGGRKPIQNDSKDRYLTAAERRQVSETALKNHIKIHQQAVLRAHKPDTVALHKREAAAAKRELARRHRPPEDPAAAAAKRVQRLNASDPLRSLTHEQIIAKLKDTNTTEVERVALKAESARKLSEAHTLARQAQEALSEAKKELGEGDMDDPEVQSRVLKALYKKAPFLKKPLEKIRMSHIGGAIKKGASLDQWVTQALNGLLVPLIGAAVGATILH